MEVPQVDGMELGKQIGRGGSGQVYEVLGGVGEACVVKIFDQQTVALALLEQATERLESRGWPVGVMPILSGDLKAARPFWLMPQLLGNEAEPQPRSLQYHLAEHPGTYSWKLVKSVARALAQMHERRVVHGNLKPGNVFFSADGEVLLSDWALGNMPGLAKFEFTDAVLYQSPEQLCEPSGYSDEQAYRWDVYAFGVLAFRVLTGNFPRCHETFKQVAPASGETRKEGLKADLDKLAKNLKAQASYTWPKRAENALEVEFRAWVDRCLPLDPSQRPATMMEVAAGFEALDIKTHEESERLNLGALQGKAKFQTKLAWGFAGLTGAAAALGLFSLSRQSLVQQAEVKQAQAGKALAEKSLAALKSGAEESAAARKVAEEKLISVEQSLTYEHELGMARLAESRLIGDRLFSWAMEKGNRRLPPLDGRELRLKQLDRYYVDFLSRTANEPKLVDERARMRLQLAEISIAAGDATLARKRLTEALEAWAKLPMNAELKFRLATDSLWLALVSQASAAPETQEAFDEARKNLTVVPAAEVNTDRLNELLAILDFHEAKLLAAKGGETKALEQLMRATQTLNRITDQRSDMAILRSQLAACYLSSATILEGMGNLGDAREVRALGSVELVKMLKERPSDVGLRLELAGCYGAMAESAVLSGDIVGAESISREAMKLLDALVVEQPDNADAIARKASQLGLRAGISRDRGQTTEALKDYDEAVRMLEGIHASAPDNATVSFRLANLWWQKGRMLGLGGQHAVEIALIQRARDLFSQLEAAPVSAGPRPEQLQSSTAYLLGDLGHALQLASQKDEATRAFRDAVVLWESLLASRPLSEEYTEGLSWCRQRLGDLK